MLRWPAWLALFCVLFPGIGWAAAPVPLPALTARVTDLTNTLDATQRGRLEAQLAAIDRSGRAQIAVLLLPTTQPETIEQFGIRLAEAWKVGRKGADNGLIVIVAKDDRRMRIEVGYGLEGADSRRHRQPHRERAHGAGLSPGRFLRRPARRRRRAIDGRAGGPGRAAARWPLPRHDIGGGLLHLV
jgi:hypothetical protein